MPQAIPLIGGVLITIGVEGTVGALLGAAFAAAGSHLLTKKTAKVGDLAGLNAGLMKNVTNSVASIPVIYGTRKVGGPIALLSTTDRTFNNDVLHMVAVWCEGEISSVDTVYANDVDVTSASGPDLASWTTVTSYVGTTTQAADPTLLTEFVGPNPTWTAAHQLKGIAYSYVAYEYDAVEGPNVFSQGIPTTTAKIVGKLLYDTRTSSTAYSVNPALAIYDFLTDTVYGRGIPAAEIDTASFNAAANYCETSVETYVGSGVFQDRYTCNGVLDTDLKTIDNLNNLLTSCMGMLVFSGGTYKLIIEKAETPSFTLDEDNIIGPLAIASDTAGNRLNRIRVHFFNPDVDYKRDIRFVDSTSFRTADNGALLDAQIDLPFTADAHTAKQIAGIILRQSRFSMTVQGTCTIEGLRMEVGDVIYLTHETPGFTNQEFRVVSLTLNPDSTVGFVLREYDSTVYALDNDNTEDPPEQTDLPDPFTVEPPTGLTLTPRDTVQPDGTVLSDIIVTWTASTDIFVTGYRIEWKRTADTEYGGVDVGKDDLEYVITGLKVGIVYNVRIQSFNSLGVHSAWVTDNDTTIGDSTAPSVPTSFTVEAKIEAIKLTWTSATDADFAYTEIWRSNSSSHAAGNQRAKMVSGSYLDPVTAGSTKWYWVRSVDFTGNASAWVPSSAGAGETTTALYAFEGDNVFGDILDNIEQAWKYTFEDNMFTAFPWTPVGGTLAQDTDQYGGTYAGLFGATGASTGRTAVIQIPVNQTRNWAGKRVRAQFLQKRPPGFATNSRVRIRNTTDSTTLGDHTFSPTANYSREYFFADIEEDTADDVIEFQVYADTDGTDKDVLIDALSVHEVPDLFIAADIEDWISADAITADVMAANSITAANAAIAALTVDTAEIATAAVETLKIDGNAATLPEFSYIAGNITNYKADGWGEVATKSITASVTGQPILIDYTCGVQGSVNPPQAYDIRLKRNGTVIETRDGWSTADTAKFYTGVFSFIHTPTTTGVKTYSIEIDTQGSSPTGDAVNMRDRFLRLAHLKR